MFKKFTTASEMLEFIGFPKWKHTHEKFNYKLVLERIGYPGKSKLMNITFGLFMSLMVTGAVSACASLSNGVNFFTVIFPIVIVSLLGIRFIIPHIMNLVDWFVWRAYARKFKDFMNEERLVEFVDLLSQDMYAPYSFKHKYYYKDLILACHHQNKNFVELAYKTMDDFYTHREEQVQKNYNENIVKNFLNKEVPQNIKNSSEKIQKAEDKFQFMG
jgi:hypothetical protein